jgi:hypothetical protein
MPLKWYIGDRQFQQARAALEFERDPRRRSEALTPCNEKLQEAV